MPNRIKLCAIAKNEGAYLADWVFHHLHFGFDGIEVWINDTDDSSVAVMESISTAYPQVEFRVADNLLRGSLEQGKSFQYRAYARAAKRASRQGFTHVAFLDLDEYWTPRDFTSQVASFVPEEDQVGVVSFQWCLDTPDPDRAAFEPAIRGSMTLQLDPHVKSVVRLDERVVQFRTHTARVSSGLRLLAGEPFPMVDERSQQWGSLLPPEYVAQHSSILPAAFVVHAVHRSQLEYVSSLAKGLRQTGKDRKFKTNRSGFVPTQAPQLPFAPSAEALANYMQGRQAFHSTTQADSLIDKSRESVVERAKAVLDAAAEDEDVMGQLRGPLHGVTAPVLDRRYPGWDTRVEWHVDSVEMTTGRLRIEGWAYHDSGQEIEFALADGSGGRPSRVSWTVTERPDVARSHHRAPLQCGFRIDTAIPDSGALASAVVMARVSGGHFWSSRRLETASVPAS